MIHFVHSFSNMRPQSTCSLVSINAKNECISVAKEYLRGKFKDEMYTNKLLIFLGIFGVIPFIFCVTIPYSDPSRCSNSEYFQFSSLRCKSCPQNMNRSADGLSCICKSRFYFVRNGGGGDYDVACSACKSNEITAQDGWSCVQSPLDGICNTSTAIFDKDRNGFMFAENRRMCVLCSNGTQPSTNRESCKRCHSNVIRVTATPSGAASCQCPSSESSHGGVCFVKATVATYGIADTADSYVIKYGQVSVNSLFFKENLIASTILCCKYHNLTACQLLGNLCVMLHYNKDKTEIVPSGISTDACKEFHRITNGILSCSIQGTTQITLGWREFMPWLYYSNAGDVVLASTDITIGYKKGQKLRFAAAVFTANGTFVGVENDTVVFHLCQERESKQAAAFQFLTSYKVTCTIPVSKLLTQKMFFYDLYFYVGEKLYPVPVLLQNYQSRGASVNSGTDKRQWALTRRFYIVDNIGGKTQGNVPPSVISYAQTIQLVFSLRNSNGQIYPPYLKINYGTTSSTASSVSVTFSTTYEMSTVQVTDNVKIAIGVLSAFGVLFAIVRIVSWRKRNGKLYLDCSSMFHFIIFACSALSVVFFAVVSVTCFQWLLFFKQQTVVYRVLPSASQNNLLRALIISGFVFKILDVLYILYSQIFVDVFFIDWERPRARIETPGQTPNDSNIPVSIIRTLFVANEWREIQTIRRIKPTLQLLLVLFFLKVVGFEHLTTTDPVSRFSVNSSTDYVGEVSFVLRFAVTAILFVCVAIGQWLFFGLIYERFVSDSVEDFVDFCSISNISIFLLTHDNYGYYIHGRSVHGRSDTSLRELYENFKREEDSLCDKRGLEPDSDNQTFEVLLPEKFRAHYEKITDVLGNMHQQRQPGRNAMPPSGRGVGGGLGEPKLSPSLERSVIAYSTLNKFLASFVEHSSTEFDYVVRDKLLLERILDMEIKMPLEKGFFYKDDRKSFTQVLLYGVEWSLLLFDLFMFAIIDMAASNYILAALITYFVEVFIVTARDTLGKKNLARKTLVHERFLI